MLLLFPSKEKYVTPFALHKRLPWEVVIGLRFSYIDQYSFNKVINKL
jgi:hypothetical protein